MRFWCKKNLPTFFLDIKIYIINIKRLSFLNKVNFLAYLAFLIPSYQGKCT
jgi:hypothetical protein